MDVFPRAFWNKNGDGFLHKHCPPLTHGSDMLHKGGSLRCSSLITAGGKRIIREKQDRYLQGAFLGHGDSRNRKVGRQKRGSQQGRTRQEEARAKHLHC